jgi:hypothetical protein
MIRELEKTLLVNQLLSVHQITLSQKVFFRPEIKCFLVRLVFVQARKDGINKVLERNLAAFGLVNEVEERYRNSFHLRSLLKSFAKL